MSPHNLLGRTIVSFIALVFVTESFASCRVRFQTPEYELNSKYALAELVAVGTIVPSTQYGAGNFQVEGIWKGPDLKMLDVSFWSSELPTGTRLAIYGRRFPDSSIAFADFSTTCSWNWGYRNGDRDYEGLIAKTEEVFGPPPKAGHVSLQLRFALRSGNSLSDSVWIRSVDYHIRFAQLSPYE